MKRGTPNHPKTKALARKLAVPQYAAIGILESLWHFTAQYAPNGAIGRFSNSDIADAIDFDDGDKLIQALIECCWLDEHETHRLLIHDWHEHADDAVQMRLARQIDHFANGSRPRTARLGSKEREKIEQEYVTKTHNVHTEHAQHTHAVCAPCTPPSPPLPSQALPSPAIYLPHLEQPAPRQIAAGAANTKTAGSIPHPAPRAAADPIWDVVAELWHGGKVIEAHKSAVNRVVRSFREMGATADDIRKRHGNWHKVFTRGIPTANAVIKHWHALDPPPVDDRPAWLKFQIAEADREIAEAEAKKKQQEQKHG
jgi:hypothetical protein